MNKTQYWLIIATTQFNVQPKYLLDKKLKAFGLTAPEYSLVSVINDAVGDDEAKKEEALAKLNDPNAFFYMSNNAEEYKKVAAKMRKLRARDFIRVHGYQNTIARVSFYFNADGAKFNISWVRNRKEAERQDAEEEQAKENAPAIDESEDLISGEEG